MRDRTDEPTRPPRRNARGGKGGAEPRSVIRHREHQVITLTEQGWRQEAIADHLGITQAGVSKILRRVDERALRAVAAHVAYLKMRGVRHLEYLSREGRWGWEQSKQGRVRRRQTKSALADGTPVVRQDVVVDEHPDPRMLEQARKAEEALADLLELTGSKSPAGPSDSRPQPDLPPLLQLSNETLERINADLTQPRDPQDDPQ